MVVSAAKAGGVERRPKKGVTHVEDHGVRYGNHGAVLIPAVFIGHEATAAISDSTIRILKIVEAFGDRMGGMRKKSRTEPAVRPPTHLCRPSPTYR